MKKPLNHLRGFLLSIKSHQNMRGYGGIFLQNEKKQKNSYQRYNIDGRTKLIYIIKGGIVITFTSIPRNYDDNMNTLLHFY